MAIAQDAFFILDDIATGLEAGLYRRIGSVVRYAIGPNNGQYVKHLQIITLKKDTFLIKFIKKIFEFLFCRNCNSKLQ